MAATRIVISGSLSVKYVSFVQLPEFYWLELRTFPTFPVQVLTSYLYGGIEYSVIIKVVSKLMSGIYCPVPSPLPPKNPCENYPVRC